MLVEHDERVAELGEAGSQAAHHLVARAPALDHEAERRAAEQEDTGARGEPQRAEMVLGHQLRGAQQRDGDDRRRQPAASAERDRGDRDRRDEEEARRVGRGQQARHLERRDRGEEQRDDGELRPRAAHARRVDRVEHAAQGLVRA